MKKMLSFAFMLAFTFMSLNTFAQVGNPPPPVGNDPYAVPVDGGAGMLLVAVAAYGYMRLKNNSSEVQQEGGVAQI